MRPACQPDVLRKGRITVRVINFVGHARGTVAMNCFVDASIQDVATMDVLSAGSRSNGEAGPTETIVVVWKEIVRRHAFIARAKGCA